MTLSVPKFDVVPDAVHAGAPPEIPPTCRRCDLEMEAGELRAARRIRTGRPGSDAAPVAVLPIWACAGCGCRQPRLDP